MNSSDWNTGQKSIVIVDDMPNNLRVLSEILRQDNYRVRPTTSGEKALETVKTALPDLILLDIKMPGLSGYEVCKKLKENKQTSDVPVIFISALDEITDKMNAFASGGVDYITKPFASEEVLARVRTHIALSSAGHELERKNRDLLAAREALEKINAELEEKVLARTRELTASNKRLQNEIAEHKKTETLLKLDEERLEAMLNLNEISDLSENQIIDTVLEEAVRLTRSKIGFFHFVSNNHKYIKMFRWSQEVIKECRVNLDAMYPIEKAGVWADCIRTGKPVIHNDCQLLPDRNAYPDGHIHIERFLSLPIFDKDQIIAIIGAGNKKEAYDESDI
ncbi:MAG: hypothetical protein C0403_17245, partial [Desulfobacterium sp.]|nr:hypothetical protein [Desulfobacterium sp.]